ncbi:MAG: GIY-YIG nuclease family protein [Bacteroidetes bacterium]|nr:GIY-YIG nuclease family protein [Bacteroidota bacterium]
MPFFVYILYSKEIDKYYIGFTENVNERLKKHLANHRGFTGKAKDWEIKLIEEFPTKVEAMARESQLKRWKNRARLEVLINKTVG